MSDKPRLQTLFEKYPPQYGQTDRPNIVTGAGGLVTLAKDVVRWKGEPWDLTPIRIYLGPWQTQPNITLPSTPDANYAKPTFWASPPTVFDAFGNVHVYARVNFGAGGVHHVAYVDWPVRGLLLQVSTDSVQIDGVCHDLGATPPPQTLPILGASMGIEPGGGDAAAPATYTYRRQAVNAMSPDFGIDFQVPPFGRSWVPLFDVPGLVAAGATSIRVIQRPRPGTSPVTPQYVFEIPLVPFDEDALQGTWPVVSSEGGAVIRLEIVGPAGPLDPNDPTLWLGMMFHLDL